ncbi:hypothetical protein SEA_THUNDERCLAP_80 [Arthrobacter phage Thunderclap]|uniref:Uncharacterized protein n=10 Tax=Amigovirus amigo TaxID=1982100 RepID=A0A0U4K296_9CAUD|nr:hypothetical protein FDH66_gp24 [Arthrobacter phage Amigo]ALY08524.1 hypothetical protein ANANSI_81 [Arthrobacter phage Anansi]ALY09138.1 hypothetical protein GORGEOUS_81 [Arthrobacter phage Gorgeous]ALY10156.1 hypothetical protein RINGS_81 [Arthrobacter phage Rings]ALY10419.1 hypothetical protein SORJUANA_81 [Arthrobacter phage SorJuana]QFG08372.1 hypothetical protein SEA_YEEZUS_81 [Arthrobacter phage Yeezus]QFG13421.1 hypothetical protein SEA_ICHOR_81 [Arthrobacter phage Ichor]QFG13939.
MQGKTAAELQEMYRNLLNEMRRKQEQAALDIWEEYMPELRIVSGWLRDAIARERLTEMQEGTPPNEYSK